MFLAYKFVWKWLIFWVFSIFFRISSLVIILALICKSTNLAAYHLLRFGEINQILELFRRSYLFNLFRFASFWLRNIVLIVYGLIFHLSKCSLWFWSTQWAVKTIGVIFCIAFDFIVEVSQLFNTGCIDRCRLVAQLTPIIGLAK